MKIAATNKLYNIDGETIVNKAYVGANLVWQTETINLPEYYLTIGVSGGDGTVSPDTNTVYYYNSALSISVTPTADYKFDHWEGDTDHLEDASTSSTALINPLYENTDVTGVLVAREWIVKETKNPRGPNAEATGTLWRTQAGGTTNLYDSINEGYETYSDTDYIRIGAMSPRSGSYSWWVYSETFTGLTNGALTKLQARMRINRPCQIQFKVEEDSAGRIPWTDVDYSSDSGFDIYTLESSTWTHSGGDLLFKISLAPNGPYSYTWETRISVIDFVVFQYL